MLQNVSPLMTPEVYRVLYEMGHLDELVIVDANHSALQVGGQVVFLPCEQNDRLLAEILRYVPLDEDEPHPIGVFAPDHEDTEEPFAWKFYQRAVDDQYPEGRFTLNRLTRQEFNARAREAYATIRTLDPRLYSNVIIRKGVILGQ